MRKCNSRRVFVDLKFNKLSDIIIHRRTMANFNNLFGVALAATLLVLLAQSNSSDAEIASPSTASIPDFVRLNPHLNLKRLSKTNVNNTMLYTLGARIAGDNLVGHSAKNQTWPTQQHVSVTLNYPTSGVGKQITFVRIQMDQSSNLGQAYVVRGGLHQRSIAIVVEAFTTYYLNYDAQIYGV
ncbi:uncharacterized protein LOC119082671 [Bradysia coprophila]|uniref:uncharacterized protein LOC119082671 n=1 Tax=Bradysia coprophila TaxID=38358 RepID=UPI00187DA266|nr:uncharacterized protein LOC119082671 [Bradysia coprophila]